MRLEWSHALNGAQGGGRPRYEAARLQGCASDDAPAAQLRGGGARADGVAAAAATARRGGAISGRITTRSSDWRETRPTASAGASAARQSVQLPRLCASASGASAPIDRDPNARSRSGPSANGDATNDARTPASVAAWAAGNPTATQQCRSSSTKARSDCTDGTTLPGVLMRPASDTLARVGWRRLRSDARR